MCDVGRSESHQCALAGAEFNSISVFLPSPRLQVVRFTIVICALNILCEGEGVQSDGELSHWAACKD